MISWLNKKSVLAAALAGLFLSANPLKAERLETLSVNGGLTDISVSSARDVVVPLAAPAAAVEVSIKSAKASNALKVYFVDVGQGDAEYIELPNGQNVLIDGGPANKEGGPADTSHPANDPPLAHFLLQKGIKKIDHVVLTHPHADHYVGLKYVFTNLPVGNFYDTRKDNPGVGPVRDLAARIPGIKVSYPAPGDSLNWGPEVQAKVFNSCPEAAASVPVSPNNCSIVVKLTYQNASLLFTGDMEAAVESQIVPKYGAELRADVLKVGHHGSAGASSDIFLNAVKPKLAYIEVGQNNQYGHPKPVTLARLQTIGAVIYRTDLAGTLDYPLSSAKSAAAAASPAPGKAFNPVVYDEVRNGLMMRLISDIYNGKKLPYAQDGATFQNKEGLLPAMPAGYYKEYTLITGDAPHTVKIGETVYQVSPDLGKRAAERIVIGGGEKIYYSPDHYKTFILLAVTY